MGTVHENQCTFFIISRSVLLGMRNVLNERFREIQNTHLIFNNFLFFLKSCRLWDNVEKYRRAGLATDDSTAHTRFMLDT